jgi:hypothetical protein
MACLPHPNVVIELPFMIHMTYEMDVVDDNHLYQTYLISIACLV